ncbi:MAG: HAMP domain-containing histidine kinase [Zoogloeaceae bacterium]|nr:HAMP domain-containing histidine kinase [Zoogloeaceae bacterium]
MKSLPGVLTQVVSNLVVNSVRHAFGGSIAKPEITIVVSGDGDNVELEYRDNGLGVPAELHQKIFEPFYTSKRGQGGSGLGLNIVYNLVTRKLRGQLGFESAVGEGVCFRLRVPRVLLAEAPLEPPPTAGK